MDGLRLAIGTRIQRPLIKNVTLELQVMLIIYNHSMKHYHTSTIQVIIKDMLISLVFCQKMASQIQDFTMEIIISDVGSKEQTQVYSHRLRNMIKTGPLRLTPTMVNLSLVGLLPVLLKLFI